MPTRTLPEMKPLVVCHDLLVDSDSRNIHLIGAFTAIRPQVQPAYPHRHLSFCVYAQLSDAEGTFPAFVKVVDADTRDEIFRTETHSLVFPRRQFLLRACFRRRNCVFPHSGVYCVELYCDGQFLGDHVIRLLEPGD
jgi:hypothetical protein